MPRDHNEYIKLTSYVCWTFKEWNEQQLCIFIHKVCGRNCQMAFNMDFEASQEEIHTRDEIISLLNKIICIQTGHPPNSAEHIYCFEQYLDAFYHPSPTVRSPTGGTLPIAAPSIKAKLQGWNDLDQRQRAQVESLFDNTSERDLKLAYDQFIKKLGRAPLKVLEFFRFFVIFEGDLFLENEEIKKTFQHQHSKIAEITEFFHRILTLLNSLIKASGVSRAASMQREGCLQNQRQELFDQLSTVREEKEKLQEDYITMLQDHAQCLAELEDERKDKQMYKQKSEEQSSTISALERENSLLKSRISEE
ncbi:uncharacterized protein LOC111133978 isoform X2 [Crassostrea virginica]